MWQLNLEHKLRSTELDTQELSRSDGDKFFLALCLKLQRLIEYYSAIGRLMKQELELGKITDTLDITGEGAWRRALEV